MLTFPETYIAPLKNRFRVLWFVLMDVLRDDQTQKYGMVAIAYNVGGKLGSFNLESGLRTPNISKRIPIRIVASHACIDSDVSRAFVALALKVSPTKSRSRCRLHSGELSFSIENVKPYTSS